MALDLGRGRTGRVMKSLTRQGSKRSNLPLPAKGEAVLQDLRRFYDAGAKSIEQCPGRIWYGRVGREAARYKLHPEMLRKARAIAKAYTERDLDRLVSLCEKRGHALGLSHLIRLVSVPEDQRDQFQREAVDGRWSHKRIGEEIRKRFGNRRPAVGRRRRVPADAEDAYYQLDQFCDQWRRLYRVLQDPARDGAAERTLRGDLSNAVRKQLRETNEAIQKLARFASKRLQGR